MLRSMVIPSAPTTAAFVAVVAFVVVAFMIAFDRTAPTRSATARAGFVVAAWLALTAGISASGVLEEPGVPPRLMLFFAASNLVAVGVALSPVGRRFAERIPFAALVGVQAFRFPLELILHRWYLAGVLPVQMTYSGHNFDIVTGVLAIVVSVALMRGWVGRGSVWLFNIVGTVLLITVATIAMTSTPTPLRMYMNGPAVELPFHFPYGWIVPFCVAGALFFHIVTFRALLSSARHAQSLDSRGGVGPRL